MDTMQIAKVCHEANRAYCETLGDYTQRSWECCEQWQRDSSIAGVQWRIDHPDAPMSSQHDAWMEDKESNGWKYGVRKNVELKEHPCMVSYDELPVEQRRKDALFVSIVKALAS